MRRRAGEHPTHDPGLTPRELCGRAAHGKARRMKMSELEARLRAVLSNGVAARRLFHLRQRRPDLAHELDQITAGLEDAGEELIRWLRSLEPSERTSG